MPTRRAGSAPRPGAIVVRIALAALRIVVFMLLVAVALVMPVPILGRPRFEPPPRRNEPAEVERRT